MVEKFNAQKEREKSHVQEDREKSHKMGETIITPEERLEAIKDLWKKAVNRLRRWFLYWNFLDSWKDWWEYTVWWETIRLERWATENEHWEINRLEISIRKHIPQTPIDKLKEPGVDRRTKYKLTVRLVWDTYLFDLETDDGYGHNDISHLSAGDKEFETVISNFEKRFDEFFNYDQERRREKGSRMQKLAHDDKKEADDMLWKLYDA